MYVFVYSLFLATLTTYSSHLAKYFYCLYIANCSEYLAISYFFLT